MRKCDLCMLKYTHKTYKHIELNVQIARYWAVISSKSKQSLILHRIPCLYRNIRSIQWWLIIIDEHKQNLYIKIKLISDYKYNIYHGCGKKNTRSLKTGGLKDENWLNHFFILLKLENDSNLGIYANLFKKVSITFCCIWGYISVIKRRLLSSKSSIVSSLMSRTSQTPTENKSAWSFRPI